MAFAVGLVHTEEIADEDSGFGAAGAGPDFDEAGEAGEGVWGDEGGFEGCGEGGKGGGCLLDFFGGEGTEFGVC